MNWFKGLFRKQKLTEVERRYSDACEIFYEAKKLWNDSLFSDNSIEEKSNKRAIALRFFDTAIKLGYNESEIFSLRGSILNAL